MLENNIPCNFIFSSSSKQFLKETYPLTVTVIHVGRSWSLVVLAGVTVDYVPTHPPVRNILYDVDWRAVGAHC